VILADATIYDAYARGAVTTLAAPVAAAKVSSDGCGTTTKSTVNFAFKTNFVQAQDGGSYDASKFDISGVTVVENNPQPVQDTAPGTLGWYYSTNNGDASSDQALMNEPLVAATQFPYSRTLWYRDGTQDVKSGSKPGDAFRAGSNHLAVTKTEAVDSQDPYLAAYLSMRAQEFNLPKPSSTDGQFLKSTTTDENNRKSVNYFDKGGKSIISFYFGSGSTPITTSYQFYDVVGRLLATISPNGVANYDGTNYNDIDKTTYVYNSRGLRKSTTSTDGGTTQYIYRRDGNIRFSQNAEQKKTGRYSYTHYDRSGRLTESGEHQPGNIAFNSSEMSAILENVSTGGGLSDNDGSFSNRNFNYYDLPDDYLQTTLQLQRKQRFVSGAISHTQNENNATWYSYDEHGRIEWLVQNITGLGVKTIDYRYGPTGAVREVAYQAGESDQFTHYYEYDGDGRLFKAYTTRQQLQYDAFGKLTNSDVLTLQATYFYYVHGPVKRVEYANKLQGIDYTYTADGSLKGINHFDPARDPGQDEPSINGFRPDVFGITLDYFDNDFSSNALNTGLTVNGIPSQYAGHIKTARWHGPVQPDKQWGYAYTYDDRYQFANAAWGQAMGDQLIIDPTNSYQEKISGYDANGNIDKLVRKGNIGNSIADFKYNYAQNTNQLSSVNQGTNTFRSYSYNGIGQMTQQQDASGRQMNVDYDVTGKVTSVIDQNNKHIADNTYSDNGFRQSKTGYDKDGNPIKTWYVHDANGNVIATYQNNAVLDFPVYGGGKIGVFKPQFNMTFYEVTDHLGTVRAVIGDKFTQEYLATMEDDWINRGLEREFVGIKPIPTADSYINKTPTQITLNGNQIPIESPNKVIRINNGQDNPKNPVGGGIMLWVHPGDVINTEVYAKYADFDGNNHTAVGGAAGYLYNLFIGAQTGVDLTTVFNGVDGAPVGVYSALSKIDDNQPKAFLTYILFDKDMVPLGFDLDQVTEAAEIPQVSPQSQSHERLHLDNIKIEKEGFIFVYVSNMSDQNMDVYFDDLRVTQQYSDIVAGGDYYPFGLEISDRQITREEYRFKYQGQYSEKDEETGWNHFELREYDPVIGRWISIDPYGQFHSPYIGMGNNPVSGVDPDGGWDPPTFLQRFKAFFGVGYIGKDAMGNQIYMAGDKPVGQVLANNLKNNLKNFTRELGKAKASVLGQMNGVLHEVTYGGIKLGDPQDQAWPGYYEHGQDFAKNITVPALYFMSWGSGGSVTPSQKMMPATPTAPVSPIQLVKPIAVPVPVTSVLDPHGQLNAEEAEEAEAANEGLQLKNSTGEVMGPGYKRAGEESVPIKNSDLLVKLNAASEGNWVKVYEAGELNGVKIEIHYFRNNNTGQVFDVKVKYNYWHQKAFKFIGQ
jgi:RHS repeat-associated protein